MAKADKSKNNLPLNAVLNGIQASPGIVIGKAFLLGSEDLVVPKRNIKENQISGEIARFEEALMRTRTDILKIQEKISKEMDARHAEIFSAHLLVLEDRMLIEEVISRIRKEKLAVEYIFLDVLKNYAKAFSKIKDQYLKERITDVEDVGKRILRNLIGKQKETLLDLKEKVIVVAYDLSPSDTASMHKKNVLGFVTDIGGRTSHTAIMAKSLEIPAVVGLENITKRVKEGDLLIVDGTNGKVIIDPDIQTQQRYLEKMEKIHKLDADLLKLKSLPSETKDGKRFQLHANIEFPGEIESALAHGAEGIGLYRSEFLYLDRRDLPTEEEQYRTYKKVVERMAPKAVVVRTMDLGGDKFVSHLDIPYEMNPFLGWRAIRFSLARPVIFKIQLRAILRASAHGKIKIMYPMISGIEEVRQANKLVQECKKELIEKGVKFDPDIEIGAMIEMPSAALTADTLAKEVNFFSIGTNDLIQYALAVDRVNEKIAYLYEPAHPAVLRLIKMIIDAGHKNNIWVGMCGEMAAEPHLAIILLGLGIDELSMSALAILQIKRIIRLVDYEEAKRIAEKALEFHTGKEVKDFARHALKKLAPEFLE
jgi:phosphotransferase system enzyme I (PtsI)